MDKLQLIALMLTDANEYVRVLCDLMLNNKL